MGEVETEKTVFTYIMCLTEGGALQPISTHRIAQNKGFHNKIMKILANGSAYILSPEYEVA